MINSFVNSDRQTFTLSDNLSGGGYLSWNQLNTITLTGNNTHSGETNAVNGTIKAGSTTAFSVNTAVIIGNLTTSVVDISGFDNTCGSLAGGFGDLVLGANMLTCGGNNATTSFAGNSSGVGGGITKVGTGTMNFTGGLGYAHTGVTNVNGGSMTFSPSGAYSTGIINIASGASFTYNSNSAVTRTQPILPMGTGNFILAGSGNFQMSGNQTTATGTYSVLTGATLRMNTTITSSALARYDIATGGNLLGNLNTTFNLGQLTGAGNLGNGGGLAAIFSIGALNTNFTFAGTFNTATLACTMIKVGTGTMTLTGGSTSNNIYNINAGTLVSGSATALGTTGAVTVNAGGTLTFTANNTATKNVICNLGGTVNRGGFPHANITFSGAGTINP